MSVRPRSLQARAFYERQTEMALRFLRQIPDRVTLTLHLAGNASAAPISCKYMSRTVSHCRLLHGRAEYSSGRWLVQFLATWHKAIADYPRRSCRQIRESPVRLDEPSHVMGDFEVCPTKKNCPGREPVGVHCDRFTPSRGSNAAGKSALTEFNKTIGTPQAAKVHLALGRVEIVLSDSEKRISGRGAG